jgi:miniconductance mechanosensitive channel
MSESFKNWRGMQQSGGRRIKRSLFIDASGVRFIRDDEEQKLSQVHLLTDYISRKQAEFKAWNKAQGKVAAMSVCCALEEWRRSDHKLSRTHF